MLYILENSYCTLSASCQSKLKDYFVGQFGENKMKKDKIKLKKNKKNSIFSNKILKTSWGCTGPSSAQAGIRL